MAIETHVAFISLMNVSPVSGQVYNRGDTNMPIKGALSFDTQPRVITDANIPHTIGNPTIAQYITLEGNDDFALVHLDQYMIITQR